MKSQLLKSTLKLLLFISIFFSFSSFSATNVYMKVEEQGTIIAGPSSDARYGDQFPILDVHHLMRKPIGASNTEHQPLIVTTFLEKGATELMRLFRDSKQLTVTVSFVLETGTKDEHYRFILTDAVIIAAEPIRQEGANERLQVRYRFDYASIEHIQNTIDNGGSAGPDNSVTLPNAP